MTALVPCIAISTGFVLLTCFICEALRKIIEAVVPEGLLKTALKEFVAGAELCGCGFELIISKLFLSVPINYQSKIIDFVISINIKFKQNLQLQLLITMEYLPMLYSSSH